MKNIDVQKIDFASIAEKQKLAKLELEPVKIKSADICTNSIRPRDETTYRVTVAKEGEFYIEVNNSFEAGVYCNEGFAERVGDTFTRVRVKDLPEIVLEAVTIRAWVVKNRYSMEHINN